jgi:hypothetical protein
MLVVKLVVTREVTHRPIFPLLPDPAAPRLMSSLCRCLSALSRSLPAPAAPSSMSSLCRCLSRSLLSHPSSSSGASNAGCAELASVCLCSCVCGACLVVRVLFFSGAGDILKICSPPDSESAPDSESGGDSFEAPLCALPLRVPRSRPLTKPSVHGDNM